MAYSRASSRFDGSRSAKLWIEMMFLGLPGRRLLAPVPVPVPAPVPPPLERSESFALQVLWKDFGRGYQKLTLWIGVVSESSEDMESSDSSDPAVTVGSSASEMSSFAYFGRA